MSPENPRHSCRRQVLRPGRWSETQILEEHSFVAELAEREIPVVAVVAGGKTLHRFGGFLYARLSAPGRRPPMEDPNARGMGAHRRINAVGAIETSPNGPRSTLGTSAASRRLAAGARIPLRDCSRPGGARRVGSRASRVRTSARRLSTCACTATATRARPMTVRRTHSVDSTTAVRRPAIQTMDAVSATAPR